MSSPPTNSKEGGCDTMSKTEIKCPYAPEGYRNLEGWFRVSHASDEHPWKGKLVCCDWDAFCTLCMDNHSEETVSPASDTKRTQP